MLEVVTDGDLSSAARVAKGGLEGHHGLLRRSAHAAEVGGGEVTGLASKLLEGFKADEAPADYAVEGGEDAGPPPGLLVLKTRANVRSLLVGGAGSSKFWSLCEKPSVRPAGPF